MTHTKKRILAMLLAVVLCFSSLPFSVSADELPGELSTESTVESQPEETPAEDSTPSDGEISDNSPSENGSITISDSSGDVPVLYAQDSFNTVKSEVEGGTNYMISVGVTRESIVRELEAHENDDFYLGTKYVGGDAQSPNGDASYNSGTVGMNCAGFISYVLRKAGLDAETTMEIMHRTPVNQYGSGLPYDWLAGASNYKNLIENGNISAYAFRTKQELLSSGLAEKGDIILMWWSNSPGADGADNHIGFFWGKASDDDVMWHSGTEPSSGNQISEITPKTPGSFYILIKIEPLQPKEYTVTLTKTSADVSITQGNSAYSLAGATYNVYEGTSATGSVVATFTTDSAGHATLSTPLEDGTYSVKEVTPPKGYKLDEKSYTFTINGADTSLSVEDEPGTLTLKLKKKDAQTGSTPQGNATLAGAVYQVSYQKGGQTVSEELTSDSSGTLGIIEGIPFGTVTVKELSAPEGYRLDTEVHTYTVDGSQLVGDTYTLEVDDLTEDVMRGGLTIQKLDSQTGTTPQGDASLEGIQFEIVNNSQNAVVVNGNTAAPGQVAMTITTNAAGVATTGENALPYGSYQLVETKPGEGYLHTDQTVRSFQIRQDGQVIEFRDGDAAYNQVIRGDLQFVKVGEGGEANMGRFANVAFKLTSQTTGESHIVVTDENGEVRTESSWNPHSQNTNGNDGVEDETLWDDHNGIWFGLTTEGWMVDVQDELCALPYCDEYGTLPKIESAEMMFSASRSRRLSIVPIIQSIGQLEKNYGKEGAEIIIDNTQDTIFGGFAPNSQTAEVMSKSLGSRTVQSGSISKGKDNTSQSLQMMERPLMTADELKSMPKGQFIVMKTGAHPMKVKLKLFFEWGISFGEPYTVPDKGNRPVPYAGKETLINAILEKYPPAPVIEEVQGGSQESASGQKANAAAPQKSGQKQGKKQGQQQKNQAAGKGRKVNATQPNNAKKQGTRKEREDDRPYHSENSRRPSRGSENLPRVSRHDDG